MPTGVWHVNGLDLYVEDHDAHASEPLLCVAGIGMSVHAWQFQVAAWELHYRTIVFDNRDIGRSTIVRTSYTVRDLARDVLALADALGLERFHLLGYSLGGAVAQEVALAAPQRVRTLTLCVTYASASRWLQREVSLWAARVQSEPLETRIEELLLACVTEEYYDSFMFQLVRAELLGEQPAQPAEAFARQLLAVGTHRPLVPLAALASLPVHVIGGERDLLLPVWKSQQLAAAIPGSTLTVIPRAPHALSIERFLDFNPAVTAFLAAHA